MTLDLELLFSGANLFVLPFWALMIVLPRWGMTARIMASPLPFVALASLYLYLFVTGIDPETAEAFSNPELKLADLAQLFAIEQVTLTGWVHFLVMDLFVGRWIYQRGREQQVWTVHSLILCLFAGPLGLLSHIVTQSITLWVRQAKSAPTDPTEATS